LLGLGTCSMLLLGALSLNPSASLAIAFRGKSSARSRLVEGVGRLFKVLLNQLVHSVFSLIVLLTYGTPFLNATFVYVKI
jgi:hypothetical protein